MSRAWVRDGVLIAAAMLVGWWAHGGGAVLASSSSSSGEMNFQFMSNNVNNALTIYSPSEKTLYVYQGASSLGGSKVNCSYKFKIARVGDAIERENCEIGHGLP